MNSTPNRAGRGDTFESRLLQALTEVDARRPVAASSLVRPRGRGRRDRRRLDRPAVRSA